MSRRTSRLRHLIIYIVLLLLSSLFVMPFVWMALTALKSPDEVFSRVFPTVLHWSNFRDALTQPTLPFGRFFLNTAFLAVFCTAASLLSSSMVAYSFARIRFFGRNVLFVAVLATLMVPYVVTMIPTFFIFQRLGWVDTFLPFMVPALCGNAFQIFFLRQFFLTLPDDLFSAARIDGCSHFRILVHIVLPLSRATLATLAILSLLTIWNDFLGPVIYLQSVEKRTLALGLYSFSSMYATEWHLMMAAALVAIIPLLIIFFTLQRYFERGIVMSGFKG